jgi:hypothetical protein
MGHFFIRRPIVAIVISILMVMIGAATIFSLAVEQYPFLAPPNIRVTANYPGGVGGGRGAIGGDPHRAEVNGVDALIYMSRRTPATAACSST